MKLTSQEMREKALELLKFKGELATTSIVEQLSWMAGGSRVRDIINSLQEEGLVVSRQTTRNGRMAYMWALAEAPELSEAAEITPVVLDSEVKVGQTFEDMEPVEEIIMKSANEEVNETLKHEFSIILRKQQRRRDFAARILQNSEAVIKNLESLITELPKV
jgi:predicted transcriptional regulator